MGAALGEFIEKLCETLTDVMTLENFQEFGKGIGNFIGTSMDRDIENCCHSHDKMP